MTFKEWLLSSYDNPGINGQWGTRHILVLVLCIALIVAIPLLLKLAKNKDKARKIVLWTLVGLIFAFELSRRIINFYKMTDFSLNNILYHSLPRPWCAISCWSLMIAALVNKKFFYNFASVTSLLCALIFFAYPSAGFNNQYIEYENLYSIATHSLLLVTSITLITLKFTDFRYKTIWKELICLGVIFVYSLLEIYVLKISDDPLYYLPGNEAHEILSVSYPIYLVLYIVFIIVYINAFYLITDFKLVKEKLKAIKSK